MFRRAVMVVCSLAFCLGATCTISCNGVPAGPDGPDYVALDLATASISIIEETGGAEADIRATIKDSANRTVELMDGQEVEINGESLAGPNSTGKYSARVDIASDYQIKVTEPTRGVFTSDVAPPSTFAITQPTSGGDASLSGFTLEWSNAVASLAVRIELEQTVLDQTHRGKVELDSDTGSHTFDAAFLSTSGFQQGAPISILLTKIATQTTLNGFGHGQATVERAIESEADPVP